jgi:hypothetical protein
VAAARLVASDARPTRVGLEQILAPMDKLVNDRPGVPAPAFDAAKFRLDVLPTDSDVHAIAERMASWRRGTGPGITLCLHGPPGTGKSEFVKYLAHRMGRHLVSRRASDLESCWVGQTEKNIAQAFRDADADDAVLLFDEVDSFLWARAGARQFWEVTRVNEFLQQLESFRGVVACTTNLWRELDDASLRRFVFKVAFSYLPTDKAFLLLTSAVAQLGGRVDDGEAPALFAELGRVSNLAPGDFAAVARTGAVQAWGWSAGRRPVTGARRRL